MNLSVSVLATKLSILVHKVTSLSNLLVFMPVIVATSLSPNGEASGGQLNEKGILLSSSESNAGLTESCLDSNHDFNSDVKANNVMIEAHME